MELGSALPYCSLARGRYHIVDLMLVATAGHIDHGKTSLIRALTGVETDRLPEERARGISIDLGFAYWQPGDGPTIGFVDVPGHERYVRNMLAGASGVDFALVVVAADDGVMPQTLEHVQILDLLNIERGVVAITKCDRSSQERIAEVRQQFKRCSRAPRSLAHRCLKCQQPTGTGIAALADALRAANPTEQRRVTPDRNFRLAIDRAFSVAGVGTVVTGTVRDGTSRSALIWCWHPAAWKHASADCRVPGKRARRCQAGERCAINLTDVEVAQIHRGDWLLVPAMHAPTTRIEVQTEAARHSLSEAQHARASSSRHRRYSGARAVATTGIHCLRAPMPSFNSCSIIQPAPSSATASSCAIIRDACSSAAARLSIHSCRPSDASKTTGPRYQQLCNWPSPLRHWQHCSPSPAMN